MLLAAELLEPYHPPPLARHIAAAEDWHARLMIVANPVIDANMFYATLALSVKHGKLARAAQIAIELETGSGIGIEKGVVVRVHVPAAEARKVKLLSGHHETTAEAHTDHLDETAGLLAATTVDLRVVMTAVQGAAVLLIAAVRLGEASDHDPAPHRGGTEIVIQVPRDAATEIEQVVIVAAARQELIDGFQEAPPQQLLLRLRLQREGTVKQSDLESAAEVEIGRGIGVVIETGTGIETGIERDDGRRGPESQTRIDIFLVVETQLHEGIGVEAVIVIASGRSLESGVGRRREIEIGIRLGIQGQFVVVSS